MKASGPGFESPIGQRSISSVGKSGVLITRRSQVQVLYGPKSSLAQLVERTTVNRDVSGSIPLGRATHMYARGLSDRSY